MTIHCPFSKSLVALALLAPQVLAQVAPVSRDTVRHLDSVKVVGRIDDLIGIARSASEGRVGASELRVRPLSREGEVLETIPGLVVTQHSGDGKANQYFVRGFNLDHGTDFQTKIDGMPVNMASHAHGQGYTDLNFIIPELIAYLDYHLGVHHAAVGDFGSAGGAELHLARRLRPFTTIGLGENGLARLVAGGSTRLGAGDLLLGGETKAYDGPWQRPEDLRKLSGVARYSWDRGPSSFSVLGMAYNNRWSATDQIPQRAVNDGTISRFGLIDSTDGGRTQRYSLSGSWHRIGARTVQDAQVFGIYSDLDLFSNFGYFLDDPLRGDQFNQVERRTVIGANAMHLQTVTAFGVSHDLTIGVQSRADVINGLGLHRTEKRARVGTVRDDRVRQVSTGLYIEAESRWRPWLRSIVGTRADGYASRVTSDRPENSGSHRAGIVSPKASIVFAPTARTELYVSGGFGFHSNDARGTTITTDPATGEPAQRVDPLVRSRGGEVGMRLSSVRGLRTTLAAWTLELDSELVFIGDGGATEPAAASKRRGITIANYFRPIPQLSIDADVSLAHAEFSGVPSGERHIPGALERVVAGGVAWIPGARGVFGAVRLRHSGAYPLVEDNHVRAQPSTLVNADAGYQLRSGTRLRLSILNLFDADANDIQYFYASRLRGEAGPGMDDLHFHPAEPRQLRASVEWKY